MGLPTFRCFFTGAAGVSDRLLLSEESDDAELGELPELPELFDDELLFSEVSKGLPAVGVPQPLVSEYRLPHLLGVQKMGVTVYCG